MKWQGYGDDFYEAGIWEGSYSPTFDLPTLVEKWVVNMHMLIV